MFFLYEDKLDVIKKIIITTELSILSALSRAKFIFVHHPQLQNNCFVDRRSAQSLGSSQEHGQRRRCCMQLWPVGSWDPSGEEGKNHSQNQSQIWFTNLLGHQSKLVCKEEMSGDTMSNNKGLNPNLKKLLHGVGYFED